MLCQLELGATGYKAKIKGDVVRERGSEPHSGSALLKVPTPPPTTRPLPEAPSKQPQGRRSARGLGWAGLLVSGAQAPPSPFLPPGR